MKKRIFSLLLVFFIFTYSACNPSERTNLTVESSVSKDAYNEEALFQLADQIFANELSEDTLSLHLFLAHPENYGIETSTQSLGNAYVPDLKKKADTLCDTYIQKLEQFSYEKLGEDAKLIYDLTLHYFHSVKELNQYEFYGEILAPSSGLHTLLPIIFAEYVFYDKQDILNYIELLHDLPRYFTQIGNYENAKSDAGLFMTDSIADEIIQQCKDYIADSENNILISSFERKIDVFKGLNKNEITLLKEENRNAFLNSVIPAYEILIDALSSLKGTGTNIGGLANFKDGKEYFEKSMQYSTGSDKTIPEMKKALEDRLKDCIQKITELSILRRSIFDDMAALEFPYSEPEDIINHLISAMSNDFPLLDNPDYTIKYVDEALKDSLGPAFYLVPPLDAYKQNQIYFNLGNDREIFTTVAHESYPGHLYQTVYFFSSNPELIRRLIEPTGYNEGWGMYTELYSFDLAGFTDSFAAEALKCDREFGYLISALADIGVNYEGWDLEEFINFYTPYVGSGENIDKALEESYWYSVSSPGEILPYMIGYLEILDLRETAKDALGDQFHIKEFHQFFLDAGPMPYDMLNERLETWIEEQK